MDQYKSILTQISTKSDAEELSSCIDSILESFYQTKKLDYKKIIDKSLNAELAEVLKSLLPARNASQSDAGGPYGKARVTPGRWPNACPPVPGIGRRGLLEGGTTDFLTSLKEKITKLKVIHLTIAFSPTPDSIQTISSFIKEKFGEEFIVDFEQDPKILGGAIIVYEGKYQDFSLKKQLNEVFEKKRKEIYEILQ